ncbi:MAG: hypothetical protein JNG84_09460 [Archangium sp.]|nr:hypothetical protein [Archangium sp.]
MKPGNPADLVTLARTQLRCFRYFPPHGGHGGDWDYLLAGAPYVTPEERDRILVTVGLSPAASELAVAVVDDVHVSVIVRPERSASSGVVEFMIGLYVTKQNIADARRLESWFTAHGVALSATGEGSALQRG